VLRRPCPRTAAGRPRACFLRVLPVALVLGLLAVPALGEELPFETDSLDRGDFSRMKMLYRRSALFLRFDVMTLDVQFGREDANRLRAVAVGNARSASLEQRLAETALEATNAFVQLRFLREIAVNRFVEEARKSTRRVYEAGIIDRDMYLEISRELPGWYGFLDERKIQSGDELLYRIQGDRLHVVYRSAEGKILQEQVEVSPQHRLSVMGSYFAPKSEFRRGLIGSLFSKN
jgi:hypothetical protein